MTTVRTLVEVRPDPGRVARYGAVVGGAPGDRLPLLYPHVLGFGQQLRLMFARSFPFSPLGLVHVTNHVRALAPIPLACTLDVKVFVGELRDHPKGRTVDLCTEVTLAGDRVWDEVSTYLHRGTPHPDVALPDPRVAADTEERRPEEEEFRRAASWRLGADLGRRYAAVAGDANPIHLHPLSARLFGFRRPIAHGMWTAAAVAASLEGRLPDAVEQVVSFRRPMPLPGRVELWTAPVGGAPASAGWRAQVRSAADGAGTGHGTSLHLDAVFRPL